MIRMTHHALAASVCALMLGVTDARAFRMIQNTNAGRTSFGTQVTCDDAGGYAHRPTSTISWQLNPASQGSKSGVPEAFQRAIRVSLSFG